MKSQTNKLSYDLLEAVDQTGNHLCQCPVHLLDKLPELKPELKIIDIMKTVVSARQSSDALVLTQELASLDPESFEISINRLRDQYPSAAKLLQVVRDEIIPRLKPLALTGMRESAKVQMEHILGNENQYSIECVLAAHKLRAAFEKEARQSDNNTNDAPYREDGNAGMAETQAVAVNG